MAKVFDGAGDLAPNRYYGGMRIFPGLVALFLTQLNLSAEELKPIVPSEMLTEVDVEWLDDWINSKQGMSTRSLVDANALSLVLWESKMLHTYVRQSASLREKKAKELANEQLAWMESRSREATDYAASEKGGTGYRVMVGDALVKETKKRVAALEERLAKIGGAK